MSRRYVLLLDGVGIAKPTAIRAKAARSARWWARRCPGLVEVARMKVRPS